MKHLITLSLFLCLGITSNSQDYIPFPLENTSWFNGFYQCNELFMDCYFYGLTEYSTAGDTIINGNPMIQIITDNTELWEVNGSMPLTNYIGSIRSDTSKVYFVPWFQEEEVLLYDFSVEIGDTIQVFDLDLATQSYLLELTPEEIYFETFSGISRKVIFFGSGRWIEGIGNERGIFTTMIPNVSGYFYRQECVRVNGEIVFNHDLGEYDCSVLSVEDREKEISIYPNPNNGIFKIEGLTGNATVELLDLSGRTVGGKLNISKSGTVNFQESHATSGIYLVKITDEKFEQVVKVSID